MLTINWRTSRSSGYTDLLPESLFYRLGKVPGVVHFVQHPRVHRTSPAMCDLNVKELEAILNYRVHAGLNNRYGWQLGEMKVLFIDSTRTEIAGIKWRNSQADPFDPCDVKLDVVADDTSLEEEVTCLGTPEGKRRLRQHLTAERSGTLSSQKKAEVLKQHGRLRCEACEFDFADSYRDAHLPYAEAHHLDPVGNGQQRQTTTKELAILCANCHRMIHRTEPMMNLLAFKQQCLKKNYRSH